MYNAADIIILHLKRLFATDASAACCFRADYEAVEKLPMTQNALQLIYNKMSSGVNDNDKCLLRVLS